MQLKIAIPVVGTVAITAATIGEFVIVGIFAVAILYLMLKIAGQGIQGKYSNGIPQEEEDSEAIAVNQDQSELQP